MAISSELLALDSSRECDRICEFIRTSTQSLKRRGLVVAVSGGIDSAVCLALASRALGPDKVIALMLPESQSNSNSTELAQELCDSYGVSYHIEDISDALEALGCYEQQTEAIQRVFPSFKQSQAFKLVMAEKSKLASYNLVVESNGVQNSKRCPADVFRQIIAATNHKQRLRKGNEYYHAEKEHYAVIGTPNLLELELGFFVKAGDGIADIKPIAHLYKSQVFQLAEHLKVPDSIRSAQPTTDTFSLEQSQEEFFFRVPYQTMDLALCAMNNNLPEKEISQILGMNGDNTQALITHISNTRRSAYYQRAPALTLT